MEADSDSCDSQDGQHEGSVQSGEEEGGEGGGKVGGLMEKFARPPDFWRK